MKKRWLMVPIVAGLLLTGVITSGAVMAQDGDGDGGSPWDRFTGRVAEILGVDEAHPPRPAGRHRPGLQGDAG